MNGAKGKLRSAMLGLRPGTPDPEPKPDPEPGPKPEPKPENPDKPGTGNTGTGANGSNKADSTTGNKGDKKPGTLVKTGDDQAMIIVAAGVVGLLAVGAGVVLYVKNRRQ